MKSVETIYTNRLFGDRLYTEDFNTLRRLYQDPQVMATLSASGEPLFDGAIHQRVRRNLKHWDQYGFGMWLFRETMSRQFVGYAWLCHTQAGGKDEIELGYALLPEFWGRGLATEIAKATVAVGFEQLALPELVCFTLVTNEASQRVMEKAGFRYERDFVHVGLPHMFYRLTAAQWKEAMGEED